MSDRKIIAFVATGEVRIAKEGEWPLDGMGLYRSGGGIQRLPIFLPIHSDHPQAAAILAAVPKPLTLGEMVVEEINRAKWDAPGYIIGDAQIAEIVNRLASEGK